MESTRNSPYGRRADEDTKLLVRGDKADAAAFGRLYRDFLPAVTSYLKRRNGNDDMLEDLVQEVFARLWENHRQFRGRSSLRGYLYGIAKHVLSEQRKRLSRQKAARQDGLRRHLPVDLYDSATPDCEISSLEIKNAVRQAISKLTSKQSQAIRLAYFGALSSQRAMAESASCSVEAFRGRLRKAHRCLNELLNEIEFREHGFRSE